MKDQIDVATQNSEAALAGSAASITLEAKSKHVKEIEGIVKALHKHRLAVIKRVKGLPVLLKHGKEYSSSVGLFACWYNDPAAEDIVRKIASNVGEAIASVSMEKDNSYCILTTRNQYTIAGPIWAVAFAVAVYNNRHDTVKDLLTKINLQERIIVFCPLESSLKRTYILQPLLETLLLSLDLRYIEMCEVLLKHANARIKLNSIVTWEEFSCVSNSSEIKHGLLGALLLQKASELHNDKIIRILLECEPEILKWRNQSSNESCLESIVTNDQLPNLETLNASTKAEIKNVLDQQVTDKGGNNVKGLTNEQKEELKKWSAAMMQQGGNFNLLVAGVINFIFTALAFLAAVAFSGVGTMYIRQTLMSFGIPTGIVPAALAVLTTAGVNAVLTERAYGFIDKEATISFIMSAIFISLPGVPGGPKTQDSLRIMDTNKALTLSITTLLMSAFVGIGVALINILPKRGWVSIDSEHLMIYVTLVVSVASAFILPRSCRLLYKYLNINKPKK
ncbi:MAG: hypothetical protein K0R73_100 [Candidatus Midichloriaceae bacterium]|jgi:hypothetical protein|nr:hypothetical protein [Candidatus Midichloriaceae bacterium]